MTGLPHKPVLAALLMCSATFCFAILDTVFKALVVDHSVGMLVSVRLAVQVALMLALVPWLGRRVVRLTLPAVQFGRGMALVAGVVLITLSLRHLPMSQTYAIGFSAPLFAALIAALLLGETLGRRQTLCIVAGFSGVVAALDPGTPNFGPALILPLLLACSNALLHVLTRVGRAEEPLASVLWSAAAALALSLFALPWTFEALPLPALALLVFGGIAGTAGQLLMVEAFRRAPTAVVSPIVYTQFIWTTISGWLVFGEVPGMGVVAGAVVVALSGVALVRWATPRSSPSDRRD